VCKLWVSCGHWLCFMFELQIVKTCSNYFVNLYWSVVDFMPFCVKMLCQGFWVQGLTMLYPIWCYNRLQYNGGLLYCPCNKHFWNLNMITENQIIYFSPCRERNLFMTWHTINTFDFNCLDQDWWSEGDNKMLRIQPCCCPKCLIGSGNRKLFKCIKQLNAELKRLKELCPVFIQGLLWSGPWGQCLLMKWATKWPHQARKAGFSMCRCY